MASSRFCGMEIVLLFLILVKRFGFFCSGIPVLVFFAGLGEDDGAKKENVEDVCEDKDAIKEVGCENEGNFAMVWFAWRRLADLDDGLGGFCDCGREGELGFHVGASMAMFVIKKISRWCDSHGGDSQIWIMVDSVPSIVGDRQKRKPLSLTMFSSNDPRSFLGRNAIRNPKDAVFSGRQLANAECDAPGMQCRKREKGEDEDDDVCETANTGGADVYGAERNDVSIPVREVDDGCPGTPTSITF
ncbi:hypothetical protein V8G54_001019 [Vigna mungo]|uniref:Uncharacterized protein n=1 Tax=Vigna mungo TaxID=3915 RepID=A0AAQ3P7J2_VIGMU